jgi:hypothetical protein
MVMVNWYASRDALKARLALESSHTARDEVLDAILEGTSRLIERECGGRWFYPQTRTFYLQAERGACLALPPHGLLAVTSLKTDEDGDRTYETAWTTDDYDLEPQAAPYQPIPEPYREILVNPNGDYLFPHYRRGVELAGSWGWYDVRQSAGTLGGAISSTSATSVTMTAGHSVDVGHTLRIDDEQLFVTAVSSNTLTVTRAVNGTTAATHENGATVQSYAYPLVSEACLQQAVLAFGSSGVPGGMRGGGEIGQQIVAGGLHPLVKNMLGSLIWRGSA